MSKRLIKHLAFLLFVMFMTNLGVWSFGTARLAHELAHSGQVEQAALTHQDTDSQSANDTADNSEVPSASDHHVLHAVDHPQLFPDTALSGEFVPTMASLVLLRFTEQALPLPTFDLPFRPPRSGALPA